MKRTVGVNIRSMVAKDVQTLAHQFCPPRSSITEAIATWEHYYQEQLNKIRTVGILENHHGIVGYGSLLRKSQYPHFVSLDIPEVHAIWIDANHRRGGFGKALIQWAENLAKQEGYAQIGIGVGLYRDYGPAQRLYFQLGYSPDGNGITYHGEPTVPGETYPLDDDLLLWLVKSLSSGEA